MHKALTFTALTASLAAAGSAFAGAKWPTAIYVDTVNRSAYGSLADTRNDSSTSNWMRIMIEGSPTYFAANISFATSNAYAACFTSDPRMVQALASANNDAVVYANWDANGNCTSINVHSASYGTPKTP